MTPAEIVARAAEDGVLLSLSSSGSIAAKGEASAIDRWLPTFRQSKTAIVRLLRSGGGRWSADDWLAYFEERAGIAEFVGALSRTEAEARAFDCCLGDWLTRNPMYSVPSCCFRCGAGGRLHDSLLPVGIGGTGRVWLHSRCRPAWYAGRKAEAIVALAAMGTAAPADFPNDFGKNGAA
jgi:hypothetical protein